MKRFLFVLVIVSVIAAGTVFADHPGGFGIGVQGNFAWSNGAGSPGGALSLKLPSVPAFLAIDFSRGNWLGVAGDVYMMEGAVVPDINLDYYVGGGLYVALRLADPIHFIIAGRLPLGLSWHILEIFELYMQAVPYIGVYIGDDVGFHWSVAGNLGFRVWF